MAFEDWDFLSPIEASLRSRLSPLADSGYWVVGGAGTNDNQGRPNSAGTVLIYNSGGSGEPPRKFNPIVQDQLIEYTVELAKTQVQYHEALLPDITLVIALLSGFVPEGSDIGTFYRGHKFAGQDLKSLAFIYEIRFVVAKQFVEIDSCLLPTGV
jgi:hypothetical protein